jgi:hypothetical protein
LETLARQAAAGDQEASDAFLARLLAILRPLDGGMLDRVARCALSLKDEQAVGEPSGGERAVPLSPELLEWARRQFTEEELVSGLQELRANGGLEIENLLPERDSEGERP